MIIIADPKDTLARGRCPVSSSTDGHDPAHVAVIWQIRAAYSHTEGPRQEKKPVVTVRSQERAVGCCQPAKPDAFDAGAQADRDEDAGQARILGFRKIGK